MAGVRCCSGPDRSTKEVLSPRRGTLAFLDAGPLLQESWRMECGLSIGSGNGGAQADTDLGMSEA